MATANDIRKGMVIYYNGEPFEVLDASHRTPGNWRAMVQMSMRSLRSGRTSQQRFQSTEVVEIATTERRKVEFSYADRTTYHFMDPDSFEETILEEAHVRESRQYLTENLSVMLLIVDGQVMALELPSVVNLRVIESPEGLKGDSASNVQKPAVLETGLKVNVPLFIKEGDVLQISTRTGEYMGRA